LVNAKAKYYFPSALGAPERRIGDVARSDIRRVLDGHMRHGRGFMANRIHATLGAFFRWALDRDLITVNPMAGMARPVRKEPSRDRVLTGAELVQIWNAADTLTADRRDAIRFLMVTGMRRGEVVELLWSDIGDDALVIPAARSKNGVAFTVPLSPEATAILDARLGPKTGRVFGTKLGNLSNYGAILREWLGI
jgi:integrase